jgi:uncharacterized membrane protein
MAVALLVHVISAMVWVGGMFFIQVALRPSLALVEPPQRLALMAATLARFFFWVAVASLAILATGLGLIVTLGGIARIGNHVPLMSATGLAMIAIFGYVRFVPYPRLVAAVAANAWPEAAAALAAIRSLVAVNLVLGLLTTAIAIVGRALH